MTAETDQSWHPWKTEEAATRRTLWHVKHDRSWAIGVWYQRIIVPPYWKLLQPADDVLLRKDFEAIGPEIMAPGEDALRELNLLRAVAEAAQLALGSVHDKSAHARLKAALDAMWEKME